MLRNKNIIHLSFITFSMLFVGCSSSLLNKTYSKNSKESYKEYQDGKQTSMKKIIEKDDIKIHKEWIDLSSTKTISDVLEELSVKNKRAYRLVGKNIILLKSKSSKLLNIHNFDSLREYIEDTSNYTIKIISNKYKKNRIKTVVVIDKRALEEGIGDIKFSIKGKRSVSSALGQLSKTIGYSIIYSEDLKETQNSNITMESTAQKEEQFSDKDVYYNGGSVNGFLNYIEKNFNVYTDIDYRNKLITISKYKTRIFDINPLNYKLSSSSTNTGISSSSSGGSGGGSGGDSGGDLGGKEGGLGGGDSSSSSGGSSNNIVQSYELNIVENIKKNIETLIGFSDGGEVSGSSSGTKDKVVFNVDSGQVIVKTKNKEMKAVDKYIKRINALYSQQIEITIEVLEFVLNRDYNLGTDISILTPQFSLKTNKIENSIGSLIKNTDVFRGKVDFNLDNNFARYAKSYLYKQTFINNIPLTITIQNSQDYVKSRTTSVTSNTSTTTSSSTEIGNVNQGININLLPRIIGDKIIIKADVRINNLNKFEIDKDQDGNLIYMPNQDQKYMPSQVILADGEKKLIGAYQDYQDVKSYNGVAPIEDFIIGGESGKQFVKKEILLIVSPKIIKY